MLGKMFAGISGPKTDLWKKVLDSMGKGRTFYSGTECTWIIHTILLVPIFAHATKNTTTTVPARSR